ncbi:Gfo/Idh/MocA family oxidoreductase [Bengtsoniella intestinalis]|uniref:Gfo/Idh/MocA family protein n=1 Tax=Bengtsoniella intestinalis TaxID=3073143 RepID=UPI00391F5C8A
MGVLRAGIIGCGKVADFHAKAFIALPESELVAVCGRDMTKTEAYAARYNVAAYTDVKTMVQEQKLDVVAVCSPHPLHAQHAVAAADCGCHVMVEKPLAASLADCNAIVEAAERNGVTIGTLVQRRFYPPCVRMKQAIDDGKLGTPILGTVHMLGWRDEAYYNSDPWRGTWAGEGGGVMATQATHQIDLLLWFMGDVDEVYGVHCNFNHPYIEVEDTAVVIVKFKNGAIGNLVMSNSQDPALYGKVAVHGSNGASVGVQTDGGAMFIAGVSEIEEAPYNDIWTIVGEVALKEQYQAHDEAAFKEADMYYYHKLQMADFLHAIVNGTRPLVDARDGRRTTELFTAVYESCKQNKPIKFPFTPTVKHT